MAVIAVDPDVLEKWAKENGKDFGQLKGDLNGDLRLKEEIFQSLDALVVKNKLNSLEKVKRFHLVLKPFTVEDGILTPSFKLKRHNAKVFFQQILDDMYALGDPAPVKRGAPAKVEEEKAEEFKKQATDAEN